MHDVSVLVSVMFTRWDLQVRVRDMRSRLVTGGVSLLDQPPPEKRSVIHLHLQLIMGFLTTQDEGAPEPNA